MKHACSKITRLHDKDWLDFAVSILFARIKSTETKGLKVQKGNGMINTVNMSNSTINTVNIRNDPFGTCTSCK